MSLERIKKLLPIITVLFVIVLIILLVISLLTAKKRQTGQSDNQFMVQGYSPKDQIVTDPFTPFEVQFTQAPARLDVKVDPPAQILVTTFPLKIGGYAIIAPDPKKGWKDDTNYKITIGSNSYAENGERLKSEFSFSFKTHRYLGL